MTEPHETPAERADRIEARLRAQGGRPVSVVTEDHTLIVTYGEPRQVPDRAGQPVAIQFDDDTWSDQTTSDTPPGGYRTVSGVVNFNQRRQVWIAREDIWRRCREEGRLPSTKGLSDEAAPWPADRLAVIGDTL